VPTPVTSIEDIVSQIKNPPDISLDCSVVDRGIDNYHVDVEISPAFTRLVREAVEQNMKLLIAGKPMISGNAEIMQKVREAYTDLMKVTLHRCKTDLKPEQVSILQFGIVKFVIQEVLGALAAYGERLEETLGQQKYSGSRSLLVTQEKMTWFRKHVNEFQFRIVRLFLRQFMREENNQLKALREQVVGKFMEAASVLCNPLLYARTPKEPLLLLDYYVIWPGNGAEFEKLNDALEAGFRKAFANQVFVPLRNKTKLRSAQSEVYDELGGLFASQTVLGPSDDQKDIVEESLSWLEYPDNARLLFDEKVHERHLSQEGLGFSVGRRLKGDIKKLRTIAQGLRKAVGDKKAVRRLLVSYALRDKVTQADLDLIELEDILGFVSGLESEQVHDLVAGTAEGGLALQAKLEECKAGFDRMMRESEDALTVRLLTDYCRYRQHLKFYRFAHRMFNRLSVITEPQKIQLAKAGGNLYRLLSSAEVKNIGSDEKPEVVHHTILKADVRGSTTVTAELTKRGLNPASYFSLRFFDPITERLAAYGAVKVFIEGDAVILGVYEYNNAPDEWFSVSRACGMAKEMIDIVTSKNADSKQTDLPSLEIGIGICYLNDRPLFLFDDNRPIMISSAIGDADRFSSCSWRLREDHDSGNFNVDAYLLDDNDGVKVDKGQTVLRYNVNGIVIDDAAFEKLQSEVHFRNLKAKSGVVEESFYVGRYPDVAGKQRDIVVRQGRVGLWRGDAVVTGGRTSQFFYEVLPNSKFANRIVELVNKKGT
jgi:hypothetical protein